MKPTTISIFGLSPAERLQLVEDLWDDLAATPETVPVHDWHKYAGVASQSGHGSAVNGSHVDCT